MEKEYLEGRYTPLTLSEYTEILKACIARLPPDMVIHRLTGDGAKKDLVAPLWSADKKRVLNHIKKELDIC
jgi:radical SAM superfamily enzyme